MYLQSRAWCGYSVVQTLPHQLPVHGRSSCLQYFAFQKASCKTIICIYELLWSFSGFPSVSVIESHGGWIHGVVFYKPRHVVTFRLLCVLSLEHISYWSCSLLVSRAVAWLFLLVLFLLFYLSYFRNSSTGKIVINLCL